MAVYAIFVGGKREPKTFRSIEAAQNAAPQSDNVVIREKRKISRSLTGWRNIDCDFLKTTLSKA